MSTATPTRPAPRSFDGGLLLPGTSWDDYEAMLRIVGDRLMQAIATRYRMPDWTPDTHALHKRADSTAAATEAVHCTGWSEREVREVLGIMHPVLDTDPLQALYGGTPWEPWPSDVAAARFLDELRRLAD